MKFVLNIFLILLFSSFFGIFLIFLALGMAGIDPTTFKQTFAKNRVYAESKKYLDTIIDESLEKGDSQDPLTIIGPFLKQEMSINYMQTKTEQLLDDTQAWVRGTKKTEPILSFSDLKTKLIKNNTKTISQLTDLLDELKKQKPELEKAMKEEGNPENLKELDAISQFDLNAFLQKDWTIPMGKYMYIFKIMKLSGSIFIFSLGAGLLGILVLMVMINTPTRSRMNWIGWMALFTALANSFPIFSISVGAPLLFNQISQSKSIPSFLSNVVVSLFQPISQKYSQIGFSALVFLFVIGMGLIISSFFVRSADTTLSAQNRFPSTPQLPRKKK